MDPGTTRPLGGCGCGGGSPIKGCAARPRTCKTQAPGGRTHNPSVRRRAILQATRTTLQQWRGRGRPRVPGRLGARGRAGALDLVDHARETHHGGAAVRDLGELVLGAHRGVGAEGERVEAKVARLRRARA